MVPGAVAVMPIAEPNNDVTGIRAAPRTSTSSWDCDSTGGSGGESSPLRNDMPPTVLIDEVDADGIQDESVPSYWTNKKHADKALFSQMVYVSQDHHAAFDSLLEKSYEAKSTKDRPCPKTTDPCDRQSQGCPCVRVDGTPGLPTGYCVRRVVRVEHSQMWERYAKKAEGNPIKASWREDHKIQSSHDDQRRSVFLALDFRSNL